MCLRENKFKVLSIKWGIKNKPHKYEHGLNVKVLNYQTKFGLCYYWKEETARRFYTKKRHDRIFKGKKKKSCEAQPFVCSFKRRCDLCGNGPDYMKGASLGTLQPG